MVEFFFFFLFIFLFFCCCYNFFFFPPRHFFFAVRCMDVLFGELVLELLRILCMILTFLNTDSNGRGRTEARSAR